MCPNIAECWGKHRTATFMILGDICTRACAFCAVTSGRPTEYDLLEPARVAAAIADLKLKHAVITSVDRDDLEMAARSIFAETVRAIRKLDPRGENRTADAGLSGIARFRPNHHRCAAGYLFAQHRNGAAAVSIDSIQVRLHDVVWIAESRKGNGLADIFIKTGIMVGLGEDKEEIVELLQDAAEAGIDIFTIGQYLRPSMKHAEIKKYYHPDEFAEFREIGREPWNPLGIFRSARPQFLPRRRRFRSDDRRPIGTHEHRSSL